MAVEPEVIIEFNKMLTEHTGALWKIAGGLIVLEVLIISHTLVAKKVPFTRSVVAWVLSISAIASTVSLVCGYFANAAALSRFQDFAAGKDWSPSIEAEGLNLAQMIALTIALLIFVIAFVAYSRVLAENIIKSGMPKGPKE